MANTGYLNFSKVVCVLVVISSGACLGGHTATESKSNCPSPAVKNGYVIERHRWFEPGDVASIQCNEGYRNVGSPRLRCSSLGTWTDNPPYCEEIRCGKLPDLLNGRIFPDHPVLPRSYVNISCNKKFVLHGPEVLLCTDDGSWEPYEMMYCEELQCPRLPQLLNGSVQPRKPTRPGKVEFSCNHGYTLKGPRSLICQPDGEWVPNVMPFCHEMKCPSLPNLANGIIHKNVSVFPGDSVTFSCYPDYIHQGPMRMICSANGTWEPYEMVYCRQIKCPSLPKLANGIINKNGSVFPGDSVTFSCYQDYILQGQDRMICSAYGTWEPYEMVYCTQKPSDTFNILMAMCMCAVIVFDVAIAVILLRRSCKRTKNDK